MKRLWASAIIFVILVAVCFWGVTTTNKISNDLSSTVSSAKNAAQNGDNELAFSLSQKAVSDWHNNHTILCTYMPHSKLEAIDTTLAALPALVYYDSIDQFSAECDRGITQIEYLNESEVPMLENIF